MVKEGKIENQEAITTRKVIEEFDKLSEDQEKFIKEIKEKKPDPDESRKQATEMFSERFNELWNNEKVAVVTKIETPVYKVQTRKMIVGPEAQAFTEFTYDSIFLKQNPEAHPTDYQVSDKAGTRSLLKEAISALDYPIGLLQGKKDTKDLEREKAKCEALLKTIE